MNLKEIREMIKLMNENDLSEIEVERDGNKIKLKKSLSDVVEVLKKDSISAGKTSQTASKLDDTTIETTTVQGTEVKSPMVGTYYAAPAPDAKPFIDLGQVVEVGQVVGIIEAMKLMNEIKSDVRGKVVEISVQNAQPIEFGQTLMIIKTD